MNRGKAVAAVLALLVSTVVASYEYRSHNRMAWNARDLFINDARRPFPIDSELIRFLTSYADDLDTRAGNAEKNGNTDEDATEGRIGRCPFCIYTERPCSALGSWPGGPAGDLVNSVRCTRDHFYPLLKLPLGQETAIAHARRYFRWAVALYWTAKCTHQEPYFRWSAQALGHVLHLVYDMGSPQHIWPENHAPFPIGNGPSFLEYWALDLVDRSSLSAGRSGVLTAQRSGSRVGMLHRSC